MQHFYDAQIRRYVTQMVRLFSNFSVKDGDGILKQVPVMYGDLTRQVANIIRDNSENKIPTAPRMAVYITGLEMDRTRTSDSSYVNKVNIRERAYDENDNEYLNFQGKNYTVERLQPSPYILRMSVDVWATNTDQKLQIMEQILMLFNPSLEIQTTDNYIDWTSLSVVNMEGITFSTRTIPVGVDSEIDVGKFDFSTPIYISPPVKVKRLGVITNIITSIFDERAGTIDLGLSMPELNKHDDSIVPGEDKKDTKTFGTNASIVATTHKNYDLYVDGNIIQLVDKGRVGSTNWRNVIDTYPGQYQDDISRVYIRKLSNDQEVTGTISINPNNETEMIVNWDTDSFPSNSIIEGPARHNNQWTTIDYVVDPTKTPPTNMKGVGARILLLDSIGDSGNTDGPDAWKNGNGTDFLADKNDIIEWTGSEWQIVFNASETTDITLTTNLNTGIQYRWDGEEWLLSVEGVYPQGTWRVSLNG